MFMTLATTLQHHLYPPAFTLGSLLLLILVGLTPSTALAQECTGVVEVGAQFHLGSSVSAGANGVAGAKLTLSTTSQASFVDGTESSSRGTWSVSSSKATLTIGDMGADETVSWGIDLLAGSAGTATLTQVFSSSAGGSSESSCTITIEAPPPPPPPVDPMADLGILIKEMSTSAESDTLGLRPFRENNCSFRVEVVFC